MKWSYIVTGKTKVAFDYNTDITGKESITFKAINTEGEEIEKTIQINDQFYLDMIDHSFTKETETQKALTVNYKEGSTTKQYKIGNTENWTDYTDSIRLDDYQILETLGNENREPHIYLKQVDQIGNEIIVESKLKYKIDENVTYKQEDTLIEGESILACVENNNLESGNYIFRVTGTAKEENAEGVLETKTETIEYPVELYNYNEDANYIGINEVTVGNTKYTGIGKTNAEKRMLILKYNKNLNINEGAIITPTGTSETINEATHLCTKKGMFIYCAETLTNNGEITMTARGTVNQEGENVYLYKNEDNTYEYVPAVGASGGTAVSGRTNGKAGGTGTERKTGGGGSGGSINYKSGAGASGTSYSGGTGGGAEAYSSARVSNGSDYGGPGGNGSGHYNDHGNWRGGGGAGNPGGSGYAGGSSGKMGTGGLIILYTNNLNNNGNIVSNGSNGGNGSSGGGSSGGGSINIFYKASVTKGSIMSSGGVSIGSVRLGGTGGTGSITIGNISTGTFVKDE